jgi:NAD(P)-dependent dehydrogenase (short-subunit alcohol dehydrogenase family)
MSSELDGIRALVTGATSGLGLAMARALHGAGATVVVTGRDAARARAVATGIGERAHGRGVDVRDAEATQAVVAQLERELGGIDVLVNNAGIGMRTVNPRFMTDPQPFWAVSPDGFRAVLDTKAAGCFIVARAVVPGMLERGHGQIIMISMNEATMVRRGFVPYGPSGAAVEALARVMAADLADSPVRVNILLPGGATLTGMIPDDADPSVRARLLDPAIMGPPVVWLASGAARDVHDERIDASRFDAWLAERARA